MGSSFKAPLNMIKIMHVLAPGIQISNSARSNNKEEKNLRDFVEIPDLQKRREPRKAIQNLVGDSTQGKGKFPSSR